MRKKRFNIKRETQEEYKLDESKLDYFNDFNFELWSIFNQAGDVVSKAREKELNQYKITQAQAKILHRIMNYNKGTTLNEISKWSVKELSSTLNLINRMAKNGLLEKIRKENKIYVSITKKGRDLYISLPRNSINMVFSILSDEEKQQLKSSLAKLRDKGRELLGIDFVPAFLRR